MVHERAAAAGGGWDHHFDAEPVEQADRGGIDGRRNRLLGAAGE
jgi:hypothetical protein